MVQGLRPREKLRWTCCSWRTTSHRIFSWLSTEEAKTPFSSSSISNVTIALQKTSFCLVTCSNLTNDVLHQLRMRVLAIVPARGGSKGISRKNIVPLMGKPLLAYTAEAASSSKRLSRTVLSTED